MINEILNTIISFYKSNFWKQRYFRRLREEGINQSTYNLVLRINKELVLDINFKTYKDKTSSNGISWNGVIAINENLDIWEKDIEYITNLIMHEFGHLQYKLPEFRRVVYLNELIFTRHLKSTPSPIGLENESDIKYFSDENELRQRIILIVRLMYENNWTSEETYEKVCKYDDIFVLYDKDLIIYWIDNIL